MNPAGWHEQLKQSWSLSAEWPLRFSPSLSVQSFLPPPVILSSLQLLCSLVLLPPLCRLSRRQRGSHPPQLHEWFNLEQENNPHAQNYEGERLWRPGGMEGGIGWEKGRRRIDRQTFITCEKGERGSSQFLCRLQNVIQLNNKCLFPERGCHHSAWPGCIKWSVWTLPGGFSFSPIALWFPVVELGLGTKKSIEVHLRFQ